MLNSRRRHLYIYRLQVAIRTWSGQFTTLLHVLLLFAEFLVRSCKSLSYGLSVRTCETLPAVFTNTINREEVRANVAICHEAVEVYNAVFLSLSALQLEYFWRCTNLSFLYPDLERIDRVLAIIVIEVTHDSVSSLLDDDIATSFANGFLRAAHRNRSYRVLLSTAR